jgi:hypothetical protein
MNKGHIMVATPTYTGDTIVEQRNALCIAGQHCILKGVWVEPRSAAGFSLVEYGRNWLVAEFLESKATHLFWLDADVDFPPDKIYKLFARGLDVIAGVYLTKHKTDPGFPYEPIGPVIDGLQLAAKVPGGFLCMSRRAVETVCAKCEWHDIDHMGVVRNSPRMFALEMIDENGRKRLEGEDYIACARLRAAGYKIYVETDINFTHYGRRGWEGNLAETIAHVAAESSDSDGSVPESRHH